MHSKWLLTVVGLTVCLVCICLVSQPVYATTISTSAGVASNSQSVAIHVVMSQTVILTATMPYTETTYYTETQVVFHKLAATVRSAELFQFRGVDGNLISIYNPSQFKLYEEERKIIADICPNCYNPQCIIPPCEAPYSLPCCGVAYRCMVAPTSTLELAPERLAFPESVIAENPEQIEALVEHYTQGQ